MIRSELRKRHLPRIHRRWLRYCLALKCRGRWARRRKIFIADDPIAVSLWDECSRLYKLKTYLENKEKQQKIMYSPGPALLVIPHEEA